MTNRTKSEFRATRERVGITQTALARILGVEPRSVRRWENPNYTGSIPQDAWDVVDAALARQRDVLEFALGKVDEIKKHYDQAPNVVCLPYWLTEGDYVQWSTDADNGIEGDWHMANANNMALALRLEERGIDVEWVDGNPARQDAMGRGKTRV
jgi:hypothetical protein